MLEITIPATELYDEAKQEFIYIEGSKTLLLEHSLLSISKWEAKWKKPFLDETPKTKEELYDYIRCMTVTPKVDPKVYLGLTTENLKAVQDYIDDKMTATWFTDKDKKNALSKPGFKKGEKITSELIYYWMVASDIPFECEKWHINRLMTLIRVCSIKNAPEKKMSKRDVMSQNRSLNARRKAAGRTRG